jgi:hypothetical protein
MELCGGNISHRATMVKASVMADDDDYEVRELRRKLRWAEEDNVRIWKLLDDALAQLREAHAQNNVLRQQRVEDAHERTVECEQRLAAATLAAREPTEKLH